MSFLAVGVRASAKRYLVPYVATSQAQNACS